MSHLRLVYSAEVGASDNRQLQSFSEAIRDPANEDSCRIAIGKLINNQDYSPPLPSHELREIRGDVAYGICFHSKDNEGNKLLIVNRGFPEFLKSVDCIESSEQALSVAAIFARAYEIMVDAEVKKHYKTRIYDRFTNSSNDRYWTNELGIRAQVPYRAAGLVALRAAGIEENYFDISEKPPYPPHIAGLMNPLPAMSDENYKTGFSSLANII